LAAPRKADPLDVALRALRSRDRSAAELQARLEQRGVGEAEREQALETLERIGYVDDERFARTRAEQLAERGSGDALIRDDLERRGLAADVVELALGALNLETLSISLGAGDLMLDLRGTPARSYKVNVQAGAGDTRIELPAGVGISATTTALIGDSNISGLEKRDGRWINPKAQDAAVVVELDVKHAVGDLRISAG